jgi:hypothetical protein
MEENEEIWPLEGSVPVERVIDQATVKPFCIHATLARLNAGSFRLFRAVLTCDNPVPVYDSSYVTKIGFATAFLEEGQLVADIFIDYATPDRLNIQAGTVKLYAKALGEIHCESNDRLFLPDFSPDYKTLIRKVYLAGVVITSEEPADGVLAPLKTT